MNEEKVKDNKIKVGCIGRERRVNKEERKKGRKNKDKMKTTKGRKEKKR